MKGRWTDSAVLDERRTAPVEEEVKSRRGRLPQHLKKLQAGDGKGRQGVVPVEESRVVTGVIEKSVVSQTFELRL